MDAWGEMSDWQSRLFAALLSLFLGYGAVESAKAQPANDNCLTAQPVIIHAVGTVCINSSSLMATSSNTVR